MRQPVDQRIARVIALAVPALLAASAAYKLAGDLWHRSADWCASSLQPACMPGASTSLQAAVYRNAGELLFSVVAWCFLYRLTQKR